jgi:hypothetical protein
VTRDQLEHAIRAVCDVAEETEVIVIGSQSILGEFPDAPDALRQSSEVDVILKHRSDRVDRVEGALGELSPFQVTHQFYVHGVTLETVTLPAQWESRLVKVQSPQTRDNIGWCLQGYDLAASKLVAFREKDRDFVRVLLAERLLDAIVLAERLDELPIPPERREALRVWVTSSAPRGAAS